MSPASPDPLLDRRRLRRELQRLRTGRGLTQADIAARLYWSPSKLGRIESGEVTISVTDLRALLAEYGLEDRDRIGELIELASSARRSQRRPSVWDEYREAIPDTSFLTFLQFEPIAYAVRFFQPIVVPGLLQVESYVRALIAGVEELDPLSPKVDQVVELRKRRQEIVLGADSSVAERHFIMDEAAIRRLVGGPDLTAMRDQLDHLIELADPERDDLTIRVVPFARGVYPLWQSPCGLIELPPLGEEAGDDADQHVLFLEGPRQSAVIQEKEKGGEEALVYFRRFVALAESVDRRESRELLVKARQELGDG